MPTIHTRPRESIQYTKPKTDVVNTLASVGRSVGMFEKAMDGWMDGWNILVFLGLRNNRLIIRMNEIVFDRLLVGSPSTASRWSISLEKNAGSVKRSEGDPQGYCLKVLQANQ
jgi:hypothetical protein